MNEFEAFFNADRQTQKASVQLFLLHRLTEAISPFGWPLIDFEIVLLFDVFNFGNSLIW